MGEHSETLRSGNIMVIDDLADRFAYLRFDA